MSDSEAGASQLGPAAMMIRAAIGYCKLGMWREAWDELEKPEPEERARPDVLRIGLGIFILAECRHGCRDR